MTLTKADLTARIQTEFANVWQEEKGAPLPPPAADQTRLLFAAVARGVLGYLKDNEDDLIGSLKVSESGTDRNLSVLEATLDIGA